MSERNKSPIESKVSEELFSELMEAVRQSGTDKKQSLKELLMAHRGQPYFEDLFGYAEKMLDLEKYYQRKKQNPNYSPR